MKKLTKYFMLLMMLIPLSLASCSDDNENNEPSGSSIVGTWEQTNDYETVIEITFNGNGTGEVFYKWKAGTTKTEYFEYAIQVDSDNNKFVHITSDDCQLAGKFEVIITPNTLTLTGYANGEYGQYVFKRK